MSTANAIFQTSTSTGTGVFSLSSKDGWRDFVDKFSKGGTNNDFLYSIRHQSNTEFEVGEGHLDSNGDLVRDTVHESTNNNSKVNFSSGDKAVTNTLPASTLPPGFGTANQVLKMDGSGNSVIYGSVDHSNLTNINSGDHHTKPSSLTDLNTKNHSDLDSVTSDQHHAQNHDNVDHTTTLSEVSWQEDGNSPVSVTTNTKSHQYTLSSEWDRLRIEATVVEQDNAANSSVSLYLNGDDNNSNYYYVRVDGKSASGKNTWDRIGLIGVNRELDLNVRIMDASGPVHGIRNLSGGGSRDTGHTTQGHKRNISKPISTFTITCGNNFTLEPLEVYGRNL